MKSGRSEQITGGVFFIGLAVLGLTGFWWPGILVVLGVTSIASGLLEGRQWQTASGGLWLIGLALVFFFRLPWWLLLALVGVSMIFGGLDFYRNGLPWARKRKRGEGKRKRADDFGRVGADGELLLDADELLQEDQRQRR